MSLGDKLCNLHLLLRIPSFARWPLEVRFFSEDVYKAWVDWTSKVDAPLSSNTNIILDYPVPSDTVLNEKPSHDEKSNGKSKKISQLGTGIKSVDPTYTPTKSHLEKSFFLLAEGENIECAVCKQKIHIQDQIAVVCPNQNCHTASHMTCLSQRFLAEEESNELVPVSGKCLNCKQTLKWVDLVKEATLRLRGEKEIARLMKKPRKRKGIDSTVMSEDEVDSSEDPDPDEDLQAEDVADEPLRFEVDDDASSVVSGASTHSRLSEPSISPAKPPFKIPPGLNIVIEESDWEGAEVID